MSIPAFNHEIEGYASATSVARGGSIDLFVNTIDTSYTLNVYRIGWYGGAGARQMQVELTFPGTSQPGTASQPACPKVPDPIDPASYLLECNWTKSYKLDILPSNTADPTDWASGFYLAKLTGSSGKQNYILFVVRDDSRQSSILYQSAFTTFAAYDNWGQELITPTSPYPGKSLYTFNSTNDPNTLKPQRAYKVSFNRPFIANYGTGEFLFNEIRMLRFLEREGYDVTYQTNVDVHTGGAANLKRHKMFMIAGHDEYWTKEIRDNLELARDGGVNLAFFGANTGYQQIRLEPATTGAANRTITTYKNVNLDPTTVRFRDAPIGRPEAQLIGSMYQKDPVDWYLQIQDVATDCPAWLCAGLTTVANNKLALPGLLGYEIDQFDLVNSPAGTIKIGRSPFCFTFDSNGNKYAALKWTASGLPATISPGVTVPTSNTPDVCKSTSANYIDEAHMTYYVAGSGAEVFNVGSIFWLYGLDAYAGERTNRLNVDAQQITRNILNRFSATNPKLVALSMPGSVRMEAEGSQAGVSLPAAAGGGCAISGKAGAYDFSLLLLMFGGLAFRYRKRAMQLLAK
jgi:hypothetical protein